jgi:hypothetical protein
LIEPWGFLFATKAGEGRLVLGVDGGRASTSTASATEVATLAAVGTTSATTTTATAATTSGAVRLDVARVKVDGLLDLLLALALLLARGSGEVLLIRLLERGGALPLLVGLAALVGVADLEVAETELLLGLLDKVVGVRDALVLLLGSLLAGAVLSESLLLLGLGNGIASLLVLQFGLALGSAPRGGSLLVRAAINSYQYHALTSVKG